MAQLICLAIIWFTTIQIWTDVDAKENQLNVNVNVNVKNHAKYQHGILNQKTEQIGEFYF